MGTFWFGYVLVLYILMETIYKLKVQVGYILTKPWVRFGRYVLTNIGYVLVGYVSDRVCFDQFPAQWFEWMDVIDSLFSIRYIV